MSAMSKFFFINFQLEEKSIELEGARARLRQLEGKSREHSSMREMEPVALPSDEPRLADTPRARPSRIPRHTAHAHKSAPRPPPRPPSAHSARSTQSSRSGRSGKTSVPVRRSPSHEKVRGRSFWNSWFFKDSTRDSAQ